MKQLFFIRWFTERRKRRIVNGAWALRDYPPCLFCQRPIPAQSAFCNWCGASQTVERHTSGQHELADLKANLAASGRVSEPSLRPREVGKTYEITSALAKAPRGQRPLDTFNKMIRGEQ